MNSQFVAALAGAGATLLAVLLKDILVPLVSAFFSGRREKADAIDKYAEPLASSSISLFYRIREILDSGRASFLWSESLPSTFHIYKYRSTIYRLAAILGWIWALRKERFLLLDRNTNNENSIYGAIDKLETAFADGPHVEEAILTNLCNLWRLEYRKDTALFAKTAAQIDSILDNHLYDLDTKSEISLLKADRKKQESVCFAVAEFISAAMNCPSPRADSINETLSNAVEILSPTQAWIYRDWQAAIGSLMMIEVGSPIRIFDLISYRDFDLLFVNENAWIEKIEHIVKDLHPELNNNNDYRVRQLRSIYIALSEIILTLDRIRSKKSIIPEHAVQEARRVVSSGESLESTKKLAGAA